MDPFSLDDPLRMDPLSLDMLEGDLMLADPAVEDSFRSDRFKWRPSVNHAGGWSWPAGAPPTTTHHAETWNSSFPGLDGKCCHYAGNEQQVIFGSICLFQLHLHRKRKKTKTAGNWSDAEFQKPATLEDMQPDSAAIQLHACVSSLTGIHPVMWPYKQMS